MSERGTIFDGPFLGTAIEALFKITMYVFYFIFLPYTIYLLPEGYSFDAQCTSSYTTN